MVAAVSYPHRRCCQRRRRGLRHRCICLTLAIGFVVSRRYYRCNALVSTNNLTVPGRFAPLQHPSAPHLMWGAELEPLAHVVGWVPPAAEPIISASVDLQAGLVALPWRVQRVLAGGVHNCHDFPRDFSEHPVKVRDRQASIVEGCSIPCTKVTDGGLYLKLATFAAAACVMIVCFWVLSSQFEPRSKQLHRSKRGKQHRHRPLLSTGRQSAVLILPPTVLVLALLLLECAQLRSAWINRPDAAPAWQLGSAWSEPCGWLWSSTMENRREATKSMSTIVSTTSLSSDVPVPYVQANTAEQLFGRYVCILLFC